MKAQSTRANVEVISGSLLIATFYLLNFTLHQDVYSTAIILEGIKMLLAERSGILFSEKVFRKRTSHGIWLTLILPMALFLSGEYAFCCDILVSTSFIFTLFLCTKSRHIFLINVAHFLVIFTLCRKVSPVRMFFIFSYMSTIMHRLPDFFPFSLTMGEAALISHLVIYFGLRFPFFLLPFLLAFLCEKCNILYSSLSMPLLILSVISIGALQIYCLPSALEEFVVILRNHSCCLFTSVNLLCFTLWLILFLSCVLVVFLVQHYFPISSDVSAVSRNDDNTPIAVSNESSGSKVLDAGDEPQTDEFIPGLIQPGSSPFWMRKVFHLAALLVYASGIFFAPYLLRLSAALLLTFFWLFECLRRRGPIHLSGLFNRMVAPLRDERDCGDLLITPIALLLGLTLPIWWPSGQTSKTASHMCHPTIAVQPHVWAGVISVAIGDSIAALVGRQWGKCRWPLSHRTLLGSSASWLAQLATYFLLAKHFSWQWTTGILPLTAGVLIEAYTEQIDNLVIPLVVMVFLLPNASVA